jgi:hypothetical protein
MEVCEGSIREVYALLEAAFAGGGLVSHFYFSKILLCPIDTMKTVRHTAYQ